MSVSPQVWVVVSGDQFGGLVQTARELGEVTALVAGPRTLVDAVAVSGVAKVMWFGEPTADVPAEAYALDVARVIAEAAPRAVVAAATPTGRTLIGAAAAQLGVPVLASVEAVRLDGDAVVVDHLKHGGISRSVETVEGAPVLMVVAPDGDVEDSPAAPVEEVAAQPLAGVTVVERQTAEYVGVSIGDASTVVGIGRGLKAREDLALVEDLAAALGGEVACSRPLAEGVDWVAKERYIGISGQQIEPALYIAAGISGQLQHTVGVRGAKVIVAINTDAAAPIFEMCDLGIVGDLYQVLPALTAAVRDARS